MKRSKFTPLKISAIHKEFDAGKKVEEIPLAYSTDS